MDTVKAKANTVFKKAIVKAYATVESATNAVLKFLLNEAKNTEFSEAKKTESSEEYMVEVLNEAWLHLMIAKDKNFENNDMFEEEFWFFFEDYNIHVLEFSYLKLRKLERAMTSAIVLNKYPVIDKLTRTEHINEIIESLKNVQNFLSYFGLRTVEDLFNETVKTFHKFDNELEKLDYFKYKDEDKWYWEHIEQAEECTGIFWLRQDIMRCISDYEKYIK